MSRRSSRKSSKNKRRGPNGPTGGSGRRTDAPHQTSGSSIRDQLAAKGGDELTKLQSLLDNRLTDHTAPKSYVSVKATPEQEILIAKRQEKFRAKKIEMEKQEEHRKLNNQNKKIKKKLVKPLSQRERQKKAEAKFKNQAERVKVVRRNDDRQSKIMKTKVVGLDGSRSETNHAKLKPSQPRPIDPDIVKELDEELAKLNRESSVSLSDRNLDTTSKEHLNRLLTHSLGAFEPAVADNNTSAVIGFDFGTSSTKIVVQLPYAPGGAVAAALTVPAYFRSDDHPHLWATTIWVSPINGEFSLARRDGFVEISDIKTQLMGNTTRRLFIEGEHCCAVDIIAIAYIALLIRVTVAWVKFDTPFEAFASGYNWSLNLGVPAAQLDNERQRKELNAILAAAWLLAESGSVVTVETAKQHYAKPEVVAAAHDIKSFARAALHITPEIVAEAVGFVKSQQANEGLHIMIDIGASTLDSCSFNLSHVDGRWNYNIFAADVRLFGTFSQNWISRLKTGTRRFSKKDLKMACEIMLRRIVWHTKTRRDPNAAAWRTELPVLVCGGGREDPFYGQAKESLSNLMREHIKPGVTRFRQVPPPTNLVTSCSPENYHRLAVAWGLSFEEFETGDIGIPSQIDDIGRRPTNNYENNYIGQEQT